MILAAQTQIPRIVEWPRAGWCMGDQGQGGGGLALVRQPEVHALWVAQKLY